MKIRTISDHRVRGMATVMLVFGAIFAAIPFMLPGAFQGDNFMWKLWYGFLALWTLLWVYMFVRNPRCFIRIEGSTLIWQDEMNRSVSGSADLARVKCLRFVTERSQGSDHFWHHTYVVLDNDEELEISSNCFGDPELLFWEMQQVNPTIRKETKKLPPSS